MGYFLQPATAPPRPTPWPRLPAPVDNFDETAKNEVPEFFTVNSGRRFYSPELGRWLNRDPIGERGGVMLYAVVGNDGIGGFDSLGLFRFPPGFWPSPIGRDLGREIEDIRRYVQQLLDRGARAAECAALLSYLAIVQAELSGERAILAAVEAIGSTPETGGPIVIPLPRGRQFDLGSYIDLIRDLSPMLEAGLSGNIKLLEDARDGTRDRIRELDCCIQPED